MMRLGSETATLFLVNLAGIMEKADEYLLPAVYKEVGEELHADPTQLGSLTLYRSVVQALCYPLAAYLAVRHNRVHIIALGAFLWSAATFFVALSSTFAEVAISRGLNGIGLAIVTPAIQSLIADSTSETNRGTAFGWLFFASNFGSIFGGLIGVLLAPTTFMGIQGWRIAFHIVGILSVLVGILVRLFARDPHFVDNKHSMKNQDQLKPLLGEEVKSLYNEVKAVLKVPSFRILVAQGVSGTFPWSALSFGQMWLELMGFSHGTTATIWAFFNVSISLGGLFGGTMGDFMASRFPNSGRIILSQISSGLAIPLTAILILGLPYDPSTAVIHGVMLVLMGLIMSWNVPGTNNPIFAEIVPEKARTSIYALDKSFETVLASFAPPIVGILSQRVFGYKSVDSQSVETDRENAAALGKAIYSLIGIPMAICCLIYTFLHCTYPTDRDRAKMVALDETRPYQIETESSVSVEDYMQVRVDDENDERRPLVS